MPAQRISQLAAITPTGAELIEVSKAVATLTATDLSALASDNSFNSLAAAFVSAGFTVGMAVTVTGFTGNVVNNIVGGIVTAITTAKMTIGGTDGGVIVDDAAGESVTITAWESARTTAQDVANLAATAAKVPAQRYTIELLNTTDSDPGPGLVKFNNATPASATFLYVDDSTSDGVDLSTYFASLGATGFLKIQSVADAGEWAVFKWTATTDGTGYWKFAVTPQASKGTLDDADEVLIDFDSDASGGGGSTQGRHSIWIPAAAMRPSVVDGANALFTLASGAGAPDIVELSFPSTTKKHAEFAIRMPKKWNEGNVTFQALARKPSGTNSGVSWSLAAVACSDGDGISNVFGASQTVDDTYPAVNTVYVSPESSAITIAGSPAAQDLVYFDVAREVSAVNDDFTADAGLLGVTVFVVTHADTDA